jgi:hypothetical protein
MGKQSKRKGVTKKAHKERRRAVIQEDVVAPTTNYDDYGYGDEEVDVDIDVLWAEQEAENDRIGKITVEDRIEEIMVGDRVWWRGLERDEGNWQRGIVRSIIKDDGGTSYYDVAHVDVDKAAFQVEEAGFQFDDDMDGPDTGPMIKLIQRDRYTSWVPRFSVGDRVVYRNPERDQASTNGFSAIIRNLWVTPPDDSERVAVYACEAEGTSAIDKAVYIYMKRRNVFSTSIQSPFDSQSVIRCFFRRTLQCSWMGLPK